MKKSLLLIKFIPILIFIFAISGCNSVNKPHIFAGTYFDTFISITIYDKCNDNIDRALDSLCRNYDNLFSTENENSTVYQINNSNGNYVICSDEFINIINLALEYSVSTNGILDPTTESVSRLYNFNNTETNLPSDKDISEALSHVNYNNILISGNSVSVPKGTYINLGYLAKGYIADKLKEYLINQGINNAIINLGGNVLTIGTKNNQPFVIGIEKPFSEGEVIYTIHSTNSNVVTSGTYERYLINNGNIYHHILDTKTGYPKENNIYSVTITGPESVYCDLYSTLLFLLGEKEGLRYIETIPNYEALIIRNDYSIVTSSNFPESIK